MRDVAPREDASRIRKGSLPRPMTTFANLAISILRLLQAKIIQRRMDQLHLNPDAAVALLLACLPHTPVRPCGPAAAVPTPARTALCDRAKAPACAVACSHALPTPLTVLNFTIIRMNCFT